MARPAARPPRPAVAPSVAGQRRLGGTVFRRHAPFDSAGSPPGSRLSAWLAAAIARQAMKDDHLAGSVVFERPELGCLIMPLPALHAATPAKHALAAVSMPEGFRGRCTAPSFLVLPCNRDSPTSFLPGRHEPHRPGWAARPRGRPKWLFRPSAVRGMPGRPIRNTLLRQLIKWPTRAWGRLEEAGGGRADERHCHGAYRLRARGFRCLRGGRPAWPDPRVGLAPASSDGRTATGWRPAALAGESPV
jgi:nitrogen fixation protein NifQ